MRTVWQVTGANGTHLFATRQAADEAVRMVPNDWGRAVGASRPQVREVKLFESADEWGRYTGMNRA